MQNTITNSKQENVQSNKYRWLTGITGALAAVLGVWGLMNPGVSLIALNWVFGILLILGGGASIGAWFDFKDSIDRSSSLMVNGILGIILGAIMLIANTAGFILMAILFAVWFIVDSCTWFSYSDLSNHPTFSKIASVIGVVLGVILLLTPILSLGALFLTVSFSLIVYGIMAVIKAI